MVMEVRNKFLAAAGKRGRSPFSQLLLSLLSSQQKKVTVPFFLFFLLALTVTTANAREISYTGSEAPVYVEPGQPTQISFPSEIEGGFRKGKTNVSLERQDNYLIVFANPELPPEGEGIIVHLDDKRTYSLRLIPSDESHQRDGSIEVVDFRPPPYSGDDEDFPTTKGRAPSTTVPGLMRELVLVAEFGKKRGIPGYRRSNRYSGELVLSDGTIEAKIDEIYMGPDLWGYVLSVENLLNTSQRINPASFRLDGARAVSAQHWELAPRPLTAEQQIANKHAAKVYIITRSMRRR